LVVRSSRTVATGKGPFARTLEEVGVQVELTNLAPYWGGRMIPIIKKETKWPTFNTFDASIVAGVPTPITTQ